MVSLVKTIYKKIKGKNNGKSKELHTASPEYSAVFPDQRIFQDGIRHGLGSIWLYVFLALMIGNCGIYAIAWQQVIKKFSLSTAYANKSVYLLWSQIWAVVIFHENLSVRNIIGILVVLTGVWVVQRYE